MAEPIDGRSNRQAARDLSYDKPKIIKKKRNRSLAHQQLVERQKAQFDQLFKPGKAIFAEHLANGVIRDVGCEYFGRTEDGAEVSLGLCRDLKQIYAYLKANPLPSNWKRR